MPIHHNMLGKIPTDPSGELRNYLSSPDLGSKGTLAHENVLEPGAIVKMHKHAVEEVVVCVEGEGECRFQDGRTENYRKGSVLILPAGDPHTLRNVGKGLLRQICFFPATSSQATWIEDDPYAGKYHGK